MTLVIRVLLVDDDPMVLMAFSAILGTDPDVEIVGTASDGDQVVTAVQAHHPDVAVIDLRMRRMGGVEATAAVAALPHPPRVIVVTSFDADENILHALDAGAQGFLLKDSAPLEIIAAVRAVAAGDGALSPRVTRYVIDHVTGDTHAAERSVARQRLELLTERELQMACGAHAGQTNEEIGAANFLSAATVKTHLSSAQTKLGLTGRIQLAILVERSGLLG
ncbi:two component transcriptional regulator, LuxR family [Sanguibacter gelidistatuariae]|uniref:Two component transcriptional regulator, LuxR family n=1 Tax=Sanguibacter gelidistatuariae TaxID=1814289 RepID=A0A1G6ML06_9MICO|nr:response regulator transcription factor [Sanguibacter gelidistatuariae]SDC55954.1 two component transcriptional regulator, LuxR family [Sanguibacter gelidistatuariae]